MSTDNGDSHASRRIDELVRENARYRARLRDYKQAFGDVDPRDAARDLARLREENQQLTARTEEVEGQYAQLAEAFDGFLDEEGNFRPEVVAEIEGKFREQVENLTRERDEIKAALEADPNEYRKQVEDLRSQIRRRDHRDAWAKAVGPDLHEKADVETLWKLVDYAPDADAVDDATLAERVARAREAAPYLFKQPPSQADAGSPPGGASGAEKHARPEARPLTSGLPGGRGAPDTSSGIMRVSYRDMSDPEFTRANQAAIAEASRAGTLQFVE